MPLFETISIDEDQVRNLVHNHYGLTLGKLLKSSQNHTYLATKADADGETKFVVRATPDPNKDRLDGIELEIALLNYLYDNGLTVCPPIKNDLSRYHIVSDTSNGPVIIVVFVHAKGEPIDLLTWRWLLEKKFAVCLGRWMSQFHRLSKQFCRDYPDLVRKARHWTALHDSVLKGVPIAAEDEKLAQSPKTYGLIHGDINISNFFWDEDADTMYMFDWDQLQTCWHAYDISSPIWTVVSCKEGGNPADSSKPVPECSPDVYAEWLLEGYEADGALRVDREHLRRMIGLRRQLYKRFCARAVTELPEDHPMARFCRHMDDWLSKTE